MNSKEKSSEGLLNIREPRISRMKKLVFLFEEISHQKKNRLPFKAATMITGFLLRGRYCQFDRG